MDARELGQMRSLPVLAGLVAALVWALVFQLGLPWVGGLLRGDINALNDRLAIASDNLNKSYSGAANSPLSVKLHASWGELTLQIVGGRCEAPRGNEKSPGRQKLQSQWGVLGPEFTTIGDESLLSRMLEYCLFNTQAAGIGNAARLCHGTRSVLDAKQCTMVAEQFVANGGPFSTLGTYLTRVRYAALFSGLIQYVTVFLAVFAIVHLWQRRGLERRFGNVMDYIEFTKTEPVRSEPVSAAQGAIYRTAQNELRALWIAHQAAGGRESQASALAMLTGASVQAISRVQDGHDFAKFCGDSDIARYAEWNDVLIKLAFIGTLVGIAFALYSAVGLESTDPLDRSLTKFTMYNNLATAFGTTLVGVIWSITLTRYVSSYEAIVREDIIAAVASSQKTLADYLRDPVAIPSPPSLKQPLGGTRSFVQRLVAWFLLLIFIVLGLWFWIQ